MNFRKDDNVGIAKWNVAYSQMEENIIVPFSSVEGICTQSVS